MTIRNLLARSGRTLALSAAIVGAVGLTVVPRPAHALGTGAAVGIGLGAFALGTALGTAAASPNYYPGGYYPSQYYYPPAPAYPSGSCWSPQYVPC
jgi:hypothetical protein